MYIQLKKSLQKEYFELIKNRAEQNAVQAVRYLDFGPIVIRVLCYTEEVLQLLEINFTYVLKEDMNHFNSTIAVYKEVDISGLIKKILQSIPAQDKIKLTAEKLYLGLKEPFIHSIDGKGMDLLSVNEVSGIAETYDESENTVYYGIRNFAPEEVTKFGHCFVQIINGLVQSNNTHLTHGAVMGYKGIGFLLCGRGKRGKSTLTVQSMLHDFDFVSDDYQILEKTEKGLLAYPIYSVITLSHKMYNEMYDSFKGKFVCNNYDGEKYIFNVAAYHNQFRTAYPIHFCLFPEITDDTKPSIELCGPEEKGRAMVHILHSTADQMHSLNDAEGLGNLFHWIKELPFYKFNLCKDISANTKFLKDYLETNNILSVDKQVLPQVLKDISFDQTTFFDTCNFKFFTMNKLATDVYKLLSSGFSVEDVRIQLERYLEYNPNILQEFELLQDLIARFGLYDKFDDRDDCCLCENFAKESDYHLSVFDWVQNMPKELLRIHL